jgi:hypothetical protein
MMVVIEVGLPGAMMSERDKKKLILMLQRIDEMHQRNDTLVTGAGAKCASKKKNTMGDNTDTTSQDETLDSHAMDLVALDSHGMDVIALDVDQMG